MFNTISNSTELNNHDLEKVILLVKKAQASVESARVLTDNSSRLVENAIYVVFEKNGLKFDQKEQKQVKYFEYIHNLLRLITYSLVAGNITLINNLLIDVKESILTNEDLNLLSSYDIQVMEYIKNNHGCKQNVAREINEYIDYLINALKRYNGLFPVNNSEKLFNLLDSNLDKIASKNNMTTEELINILDPNKSLIQS